jgi:predicted dehydrogenase
MIRQARAMIASGELGDIRVVQMEYAQDWLSTAVEHDGLKQAQWRTDPSRSGAGGSVGDIGTHAHNLACFVTGLSVDSLAADLQSFGAGRTLDDNAHVLLRFNGGARGMLWCSQVANGNENALTLRVFGTKGGISWSQEDPNYLWFTPQGDVKRLVTRAGVGADAAAGAVSRIPGGHPEGYLEAFANLYTEAADAIRAAQDGTSFEQAMGLLPGIATGLDGMSFINACVKSSSANAAWVDL